MNKVALITGGSGTIGSSIANLLSKNNYDIIITYHNSKSKAQQVLSNLDNTGNHSMYHVDICNSDSIKQLFETVYKKYKKINLLVNNAAYTTNKDLFDLTDNDIDSVVDSNIKNVFYSSREFVKRSIKDDEYNIINIGSNSTHTLNASNIIYIACKAGVENLTKTFAKQFGHIVRVNCVLPGLVKSNITNSSPDSRFEQVKNKTPMNRICTPEDIACSVFALVENTKFVNGQSLVVDGGRNLYA